MNLIHRLATGLRRRDPDLAATRRAARTALVMPVLFALCVEVFHAPVVGTFAAFGSFAMLLLVEFTGPWPERLRSYAALGLAWMVLVILGTLAARSVWSAVAATVVVGFVVLFSGVVSSVLAGATTALLLGFILPVSAAVPLSQLPDRLLGVALATVAAMAAVSILWPRVPEHPLSAPAASVCRAAARQLRAESGHYSGQVSEATFARCLACARETEASALRLRQSFTETPYRPTGLGTSSRAMIRLVDELTWLSAVLADSSPAAERSHGQADDPESSAVRESAATVLDLAAEMLEDPGRPPYRLREAAAELRGALSALEDEAVNRLPIPADVDDLLGSLDVSFRAQEVAFVVLQLAANLDLARSAERRSWRERLLGREPGAATGALASAWERALAHLEPHSVALHNSVRGAAGLGVGVVIADLADVQHAFWVMLGTVSVLRSNALTTGQNAFRALGGTVAGSVIGVLLLQLIGARTELLWALLPIAVLLSGIVPAAVSFAAGQAAFTLTVVILFNIAQPEGLSVILFRIEDVALGCAVSLVVGLFFWPRGASAAVSRALAEAYADSARYLLGAVDYAVSRCSSEPGPIEVPQEGRRAASAARRLDDAFRTYLTERGQKDMPLGGMTTLVTGVVGLRLAADAVLELWRRSPGGPPPEDRADARRELRLMADGVFRWYESFAAGLEGRTPVPEPDPVDRPSDNRLVEAVRDDLEDAAGRATGVRVIWTGDHLQAARRLQGAIAAAAARGDAGEERR
ncbi:FUSC family protein [Nonomuraea sp. NPDC050790]|uniref:FUSC family protein n=1 Tax=Nonomuraea sp. NPDC050790 TaxID=3364371 RepID=UPI0037988414